MRGKIAERGKGVAGRRGGVAGSTTSAPFTIMLNFLRKRERERDRGREEEREREENKKE